MDAQQKAGIGQEGSDLLTGGEGTQTGAGADQSKAGQGNEGGQDHEGGDTTRPAWMDQLADDLKESKGLTKFKNISELGKAYGELEGKLGNSISIPGEDASDEDLANFFGKLGRPESADKYELQYEEGFPEYLKSAMGASESGLREMLHKNGASQKQAVEVFNWIQKELYAGEKLEQTFKNKQITDGTKQLKEDWGADYDANMNVMGLAVRTFADEGFINAARETGFANHPGMIKTFLKIGQAISEDRLVGGGNPGGDPTDDTLRW